MNLISKAALLALAFACTARAEEGEFDPVGEFVIRSQTKITGTGKAVQVPIKPLKLSVSTDGVTIRLASGTQTDAWSTFTIYRSDGIGRQNVPGGPLEVVPGVQATSDHGGVHKHLRLTRDTLTLTVFPGVSDQTLITHAVLATPSPDEQPAPDSGTESPAP
jgi:hypothetical protein